MTGVMISMRGDGANNTTIHGSFRSGYIFDFSESRPYRSIRDLEFVGGGPNGRGKYGGAMPSNKKQQLVRKSIHTATFGPMDLSFVVESFSALLA